MTPLLSTDDASPWRRKLSNPKRIRPTSRTEHREWAVLIVCEGHYFAELDSQTPFQGHLRSFVEHHRYTTEPSQLRLLLSVVIFLYYSLFTGDGPDVRLKWAKSNILRRVALFLPSLEAITNLSAQLSALKVFLSLSDKGLNQGTDIELYLTGKKDAEIAIICIYGSFPRDESWIDIRYLWAYE